MSHSALSGSSLKQELRQSAKDKAKRTVKYLYLLILPNYLIKSGGKVMKKTPNDHHSLKYFNEECGLRVTIQQ